MPLRPITIARHYRDWPTALRGGVVAIGNFDGLHRGHCHLLSHAKALAAGRPLVVLSFEPHPRRFFSGERTLLRLMPLHLKLRELAAMGVDGALVQRFDASFAALSADDFIDEVLVDALGAQQVVTGADFCFGKGRSGSAESLRVAATRHGFVYDAVAPLLAAGDDKIGSQAIRAAVAAGDMAQAAAWLGRPYGWLGRVIAGDARGRTLGFPTANLLPPPVLPPAYGVYAVRARLWHGGAPMDGVANWGIRPTVGGSAPRLEVHLFDRDIDLYGKRLYVEWIARLRDEQRFESMEALRQQIQQDEAAARALLAR